MWTRGRPGFDTERRPQLLPHTIIISLHAKRAARTVQTPASGPYEILNVYIITGTAQVCVVWYEVKSLHNTCIAGSLGHFLLSCTSALFCLDTSAQFILCLLLHTTTV